MKGGVFFVPRTCLARFVHLAVEVDVAPFHLIWPLVSLGFAFSHNMDGDPIAACCPASMTSISIMARR